MRITKTLMYFLEPEYLKTENLSNLPPHYVTTEKGALVLSISIKDNKMMPSKQASCM